MIARTLWNLTRYNFNVTGVSGLSFLSDYTIYNMFVSKCLGGSLLFFKEQPAYQVLRSFFVRNFRTLTAYQRVYGFRWFRFVLFSGLGYKRRLLRKQKIMFSYIGDRHWILYKFGGSSMVDPNRRRNFIFFSHDKGSFLHDYSFFSSLRKPYVYKMKGFLDARVRGRFLFVRRIKIRGVKTKLSKKQKLL